MIDWPFVFCLFGECLCVVCLDGSSPAYHLDRGFGAGASNWLLQFEVSFIDATNPRAPHQQFRRPEELLMWCSDSETSMEFRI